MLKKTFFEYFVLQNNFNIAKLGVTKSESHGVSEPYHFVTNEFKIVAFDNFNHSERAVCHDFLACVKLRLMIYPSKHGNIQLTFTQEKQFETFPYVLYFVVLFQ